MNARSCSASNPGHTASGNGRGRWTGQSWRILLVAASSLAAPVYSQEIEVTDLPAGVVQQWEAGREDGESAEPMWKATVDALMLWQGNIASVPIFTTDSGRVVVDANDAEPAMTAGPRFGLIREIGETHAIEGNYFNVRSFEGTSALPATGGPFVINPALGNLIQFGDIQAGQLTTNSQIQSAELNWRTWNGGMINWLAGFRWVEWDQQSTVGYTFNTPTTLQSGNVSLGNDIGNNLYGGQLGADVWLWNNGGPWRVNAIGKAGVYYNSAAYSRSLATVTDASGTDILGESSAVADETAFVGELGVNASYDVTSWLALRAGYTLFWLSGVATAPDNLLAANIAENTAIVNTQGSVLLHGITAGLEARW